MNIELKAAEIAALLKSIANKNRLLILCTLLEKDMSVNEIIEALASITQSAVSQHLAALKTSGLLENEKQGKKIIYRIKDRRIETLISVIKENYCK